MKITKRELPDWEEPGSELAGPKFSMSDHARANGKILPLGVVDLSDEGDGGMSLQEHRMMKHLLTTDHLAFTRFFLKKRDGNKFIMSDHHCVMAETLSKVYRGEITRLIMNVPPGYTKTEMAVINFIAHGLAINPRAKFIHISYADQLAMLNSSNVKEICTSPDYNRYFPMTLKDDAQSKKAWYNHKGGGMMAVAAGGTITGFRAGRMMPGFSGAMIIDDPIKPDDAYSDTIRQRVNNRFNNTFKSRLAHEGIAIIVIMQRIHEDDPTGFLLGGGTGEKWHHLLLPAEVSSGGKKDVYPKEYTHGIEIKHNLKPGPLWEYKHTLEQLASMRKSDPYTTSAQYDQRPSPVGGGLFKDNWWKYYKSDVEPNVDYRFITADTAQKTKEVHDWSVFQCWGFLDNNLYLLDLIRGKWESPQLRPVFKSFIIKHCGSGKGQVRGKLRYAAVEDKSSGTDLIQSLSQDPEITIPIQAIQRSTDKVRRANDFAPYIASGRIFLPTDAEWLSDYQLEFRKFTPMMTHKWDDQIDPTLDAIQLELSKGSSTSGTW
jgi:predicted phage terminase large subunit-like protein